MSGVNKDVEAILTRVQSGALDLREVGRLLNGYWSQDLPRAILDAAAALSERDKRIEELEEFVEWVAGHPSSCSRQICMRARKLRSNYDDPVQ
jgi:hypothetical protein